MGRGGDGAASQEGTPWAKFEQEGEEREVLSREENNRPEGALESALRCQGIYLPPAALSTRPKWR